ncbi:hypothetical protein [Corallococcus sp. M7]
MLVLSAVLAACGPANEPQQLEGRARIGVQAFGLASLGSVEVTAQPGTHLKTLVLDEATHQYQGELVLSAGTYTLTVNGYLEESNTLAATGEATVTVVGGSTTAATVVIVDQTAQEARPTINVIVKSVTASSVEFPVGTATTLAVDLVNYDNMPVTYSWTSDCPSGVFSAPGSASTTWMNSQAAACTLAVSVVSKGVDFNASIPVRVRSGNALDGVVDVGAMYVSRPRIYTLGLSASGSSSYSSYISRDAGLTGANFRDGVPGQVYRLTVDIQRATQYGRLEIGVSDDCGGTFTLDDEPYCYSYSYGSYCSYLYRWASPSAANTVCKISARATNDTLVDEFAGAIHLK